MAGDTNASTFVINANSRELLLDRDAAEAVANAFGESGAPALNGAVIDRTLQRAGAGLAERKALNARGYISVPLHPDHEDMYGEADVWEPGIPSLMVHVLKKAAAQDAI